MRGEITEAVEYLGSLLSNQPADMDCIPRRKIGLFQETITKLLLDRFTRLRWDITNPSLDSEHRVLSLGKGDWGLEMVGKAAKAVGLDPEEVLNLLPPYLILHIHPEVVAASLRLHTTLTRIGNGSSKGSGMLTELVKKIGDMPVDTNGRSTHGAVPTGCGGANPPVVNSASDAKWTVEDFAKTRFGTAKQKHSLNFIRSIQDQAMVNSGKAVTAKGWEPWDETELLTLKPTSPTNTFSNPVLPTRSASRHFAHPF